MEEEELSVVDEILQNYTVSVLKDTKSIREIKILNNDRSSTRDAIENALYAAKIPFGALTRDAGSFGGTEFNFDQKKVRFIYKPQTGGGGSGAGAEDTARNESAQAVYAAIAFGMGKTISNNDVTMKTIQKYSNLFSIDGNIDDIRNNLPDDWIKSSVTGANALYNRFGRSGKYTFHRGDATVNRINSAFTRVKSNEGVRMDINKWNPSDIWLVRSDYDFKCIDDEKTLLGLNQCIQEQLQDGRLIGISLKKMQSGASLSAKNVFNDMKNTKKYTGYEYSNKSIDGYILLSGGTKVQFRSFGAGQGLTGFQGEVKGANANQGKIGLGPTNMILRTHGVGQIPTNAASRVKTDPDGVFNEIAVGLKKYARMSQKQIDELRKNEKINTPKFLYSKLQVTQLLDTIQSIRNKDVRDQLVEDIYLYASSQSRFSSAYYKLE